MREEQPTKWMWDNSVFSYMLPYLDSSTLKSIFGSIYSRTEIVRMSLAVVVIRSSILLSGGVDASVANRGGLGSWLEMLRVCCVISYSRTLEGGNLHKKLGNNK